MPSRTFLLRSLTSCLAGLGVMTAAVLLPAAAVPPSAAAATAVASGPSAATCPSAVLAADIRLGVTQVSPAAGEGTGRCRRAPRTARYWRTAVQEATGRTTETNLKTIGYVAYWDQRRALAGLGLAARGGLDEVSPSWYAPTADGRLVVQEAGKVSEDATVVAAMKSAGVRVVPAVANYIGKRWDTKSVSTMLASPAARQRMVTSIMEKVRQRGYDGIDLDFEHGVASDRANYVRFAQELATALHAEGKTLSVTVHPKQSEPGPQPKNQAQDYARLGAAADEFRIMLYDYHWETSSPGPLAPLAWVKRVAAFAVSQVPADKVVLGFATYGYDWPGTRPGESQMYAELAATARARGQVIGYNPVGGSTFRYSGHTVWLEDSVSLTAKVAVARDLGLRGVHLWRLGGEDPRIWSSGVVR